MSSTKYDHSIYVVGYLVYCKWEAYVVTDCEYFKSEEKINNRKVLVNFDAFPYNILTKMLNGELKENDKVLIKCQITSDCLHKLYLDSHNKASFL